MIHVGALPGTPAATRNIASLTKTAVAEARLYLEHGFDGLLIENMHDLPYLRGTVGPEITASLAIIAHTVKSKVKLPIGLQILAAANTEALAVAHAAGLNFIRAEGFAFAHVADEGIIEACAGPLLRYRKQIGAEAVQVWADVKKKHSAHAITADVSLGEIAEAVEFMRGDAVIVTGTVTGAPPTARDVTDAKTQGRLPVMLGSGINANNLAEFYAVADGFIIGSACKVEGHWRNPLDPARVAGLARAVKHLRA